MLQSHSSGFEAGQWSWIVLWHIYYVCYIKYCTYKQQCTPPCLLLLLLIFMVSFFVPTTFLSLFPLPLLPGCAAAVDKSLKNCTKLRAIQHSATIILLLLLLSGTHTIETCVRHTIHTSTIRIVLLVLYDTHTWSCDVTWLVMSHGLWCHMTTITQNKFYYSGSCIRWLVVHSLSTMWSLVYQFCHGMKMQQILWSGLLHHTHKAWFIIWHSRQCSIASVGMMLE